MTTIYLTSDVVNYVYYYFVPDATTLAEGQALNIPNTVWAIGDINVANAQLATNQQTYENSEYWLPHFSQLKSIGTNPDGSNIWGACSITTEPANTTMLYELFCDVQMGYQLATGTASALTIYGQQEQAVLAWAGLAEVTTLNALPPAPKPPKG
jgi:hypothetical protein